MKKNFLTIIFILFFLPTQTLTASSETNNFFSNVFSNVKKSLVIKSNNLTENFICNEDKIISLANDIIDNRDKMGKFHFKRVGGDEAYLILKYNKLDYVDASKLFARLEPLRTQYDIKASFSIHKNGITETINQSALSPSDWFLERDIISLREIILKDNGETFLYLWEKAKLNEEKFKNFFYLRQFHIPRVLGDQNDKFKLNFAKLAEKNGELILAGSVLSSMKNLSAYKKFLLKHRSNETVYNVTNEKWAYNNGNFSLHHKKLPFLIWKIDSDSKKMQEDLYDVMRVIYFMPEKDFFGIALNQSGFTSKFAEISQKYFLALDNNKIPNSFLADNHWIFLYEELINEFGKEETELILSGFAVNLRYFSDNVPETISWFLALREIVPFVKNKTTNIPNKPINLIDGFEWDKFLNVAEIIKQREENKEFWINFDEQELFFAAEILFALGEIDLSIDVIENLEKPRTAIKVKQSFMKRLDKHCKNYLSFPGSSLWNAGDDGMYIFNK